MNAKSCLVLVPLLLGGCAASSYCEGDQDYEQAGSVPVVQPSDGLQLKESSTALKIPPPPETTVPYGEKFTDAKGKEGVRCLDQPPALVMPEPKPAEGAAPVETPSTPPPATPPAPGGS